jgi:hypothetical protein
VWGITVGEPLPVPGKEDVWPYVLQDCLERVKSGKATYGTYLQTHNGRNPLEDLKDELWDAIFYITQFLLETRDG